MLGAYDVLENDLRIFKVHKRIVRNIAIKEQSNVIMNIPLRTDFSNGNVLRIVLPILLFLNKTIESRPFYMVKSVSERLQWSHDLLRDMAPDITK
jgi:hypothetical protein